MDDQHRNSEISTEEASSNFFWTVGETEVFSVQTTLRGCPVSDQVLDHIKMVKASLRMIVKEGGHAKTGSGQMSSTVSGPASTNGNGLKWTDKTIKGARVFKLSASAPEPEEIECNVHPGKKMKRRVNDRGAWWSHKDGEKYCTANMEREG